MSESNTEDLPIMSFAMRRTDDHGSGVLLVGGPWDGDRLLLPFSDPIKIKERWDSDKGDVYKSEALYIGGHKGGRRQYVGHQFYRHESLTVKEALSRLVGQYGEKGKVLMP